MNIGAITRVHSAHAEYRENIIMKSVCLLLTQRPNAQLGGPHFGLNSPLYRAKHLSNPHGMPGGMGSFGIDWYVIVPL